MKSRYDFVIDREKILRNNTDDLFKQMWRVDPEYYFSLSHEEQIQFRKVNRLSIEDEF